MKLTKYLMIALAGVLVTACSNDDEWNTKSGATVEMANATMKVKENTGVFNVPLKLTGTTNGPVQVTVQITEVSENPAIEDVDFLVTSKTIVIPNDSTQVGVEIVTVSNGEVNDDTMFEISIVKVEGASVGKQKSTVVTIADVDGLFYEAIQGAWKWNSTSFYGGSANWSVNIVGVSEEDEGYEQVLYMTGWMGYNWVIAEMEYSIDSDNNISLYFPYGQIVATDVNFSGLGLCDVGLFGVEGGYLVEDGGFEGIVSSDLQSVSFDPDLDMILYVLQGDEGMGAWERCIDVSMTR